MHLAVFGRPYAEMDPDQWDIVRSITMERHFALNWLCGYPPDNDWDQTPTDDEGEAEFDRHRRATFIPKSDVPLSRSSILLASSDR